MASFLSGLLGMSEQELRFHVQRANYWTFAPLLSIFPALPFSHTSSCQPPSASPSASPVREPLDLPLSSQSPQLMEGQSGEQTRRQSDALAFLPPRAVRNLNLEVEDTVLSSSHSEEDLAGWREGLPQHEEEETQSCLSEEGSFDDGEVLSSDEEEMDGFVVGGLDVCQSLQGASMSQLDGGCLAKIMSHMDLCTLRDCSLVSREWLEASSFARSSMRLQESTQIAALPKLLVRFSRIQTLLIQRPSNNKDKSAVHRSQQTAMLLGNCTMELIAQGCCKLQKLHLQNCSISDAGLAVVLRSCPDLQSLHLRFSEGFSGDAFSGLCCKLEKLELRGCKDLTSEGLLAAAVACAQLEDLGVMSGRPNLNLVKGLEGFAKSCPQLRALASHGCGITDQTLSCFAASCPLLQKFTICCENFVTDAGLTAFFAELPLMHTVKLINNQSLSGLPSFRSNQCLRTLRLELLWETTELAFQVVADQVNLERLELVCCPTLTNTTLAKVFASCKSLKCLQVYSCELVTADFVSAYIKSGSTAKLEILRCHKVPRGSLEEAGLQLDKHRIQYR